MLRSSPALTHRLAGRPWARHHVSSGFRFLHRPRTGTGCFLRSC